MTFRVIGIDASRAAKAERTGTETYALELIKQFSRMASSRWRLRLYTPHPPQHTEWPDSTYVETRVIPFPRLWTHIRLAAELRQQPPSVLFVPAHVLPWYCPVRSVVTVHDVGYHYYPEAHGRFSRAYLAWTTRRHAHVADHVIADSEATRQDLLRLYHAEPTRVSVVHLGRNPHLKRASATEIDAVKAKYQLGDKYLLFIGTLQPRKNLVRLIQAFQQTVQSLQQPTLQLVIAGGKGWLYDEIFAEVTRLGLQQQVIFTGYVPEEEKAALISGAVIYLFPSLYEGFGLPILEAMACGTPVLTSNVSSLPEVAGEAAMLVNPHNTVDIVIGLIALLTNPRLRHTLIERGYQQVENFSWSQAARQIFAILTNLRQNV